jgi:hypothetical protein
MMEAATTAEILVNFYQTAWRYNPEDSHLRTHRRENLKSHNVQEVPIPIDCRAKQKYIFQVEILNCRINVFFWRIVPNFPPSSWK